MGFEQSFGRDVCKKSAVVSLIGQKWMVSIDKHQDTLVLTGRQTFGKALIVILPEYSSGPQITMWYSQNSWGIAIYVDWAYEIILN